MSEPAAEDPALQIPVPRARPGSLPRTAKARTGTGTAWPALMMSLLFLRHCAPRQWNEITGIIADEEERRAQGRGTVADLAGEIGTRVTAAMPGGFLGTSPRVTPLIRPLGNGLITGGAVECAYLGPGAYSRFLGDMAAAAHPGVSSSPTPPEAARLMAGLAVAGASGGSLRVWDPYLRGGELITAAWEAWPAGDDFSATGDCPRPVMAPFSAMGLVLAGVPHAALTETRAGKVPGLREAGIILLAPPFNEPGTAGNLNTGWPLGEPPSGKSHHAWLQYALTCLPDGGRGAVLMPLAAGSARSPSQRAIREAAVSAGAVDAVLALPPGLFESSTARQALWIIRRPAGAPGPVLFADLSRMTAPGWGEKDLAPGTASTVTGLYRNRPAMKTGTRENIPGGGTAILAAPDTIRDTEWSLSPARYLQPAPALDTSPAPALGPLLGSLRTRSEQAARETAPAVTSAAAFRYRPAPGSGLPRGWRQVPLTQICDIQAGPHRNKVSEAIPDGDVPVIQPRHLNGGHIDAAGADRVSEETALAAGARFRLKPGDIVSARAGAIGPAALSGPGHAGWIMGQNLLRIRVTSRAEADPAYLREFLALPGVLDWIREQAKGATVPTLSHAVLGTLPVPLPPLAVQQEAARMISGVAASAGSFRSLADSADQARTALAEGLLSGRLEPGRPRRPPAAAPSAARVQRSTSRKGR